VSGPTRAGDTAAAVFGREWGRAVAVVARLTGDLSLAEDAVQEAFAVALDRWAHGPLPRDPAGWLITVARNQALDQLRRESRRSRKEEAAMRLLSERDPRAPEMIVDDRLRLIFACCHPAARAWPRHLSGHGGQGGDDHEEGDQREHDRAHEMIGGW